MKNSVKNARFVTIMFLFASSASVLGKKFNFKDKNESLQAIVSANTSVFSRDNLLVSWGTPGNKEHDEAINLWNDLLEGIEKYVDKNNPDLKSDFATIKATARTTMNTLNHIYDHYIKDNVVDTRKRFSGVSRIDPTKLHLKNIDTFGIKNTLNVIKQRKYEENIINTLDNLNAKLQKYRKSKFTRGIKGDVADVLFLLGNYVLVTLQKVTKDFGKLKEAVSEATFSGS